MKVLQRNILTVIFAAVMISTLTASAELWNWTKVYLGPKHDIVTLVITSNYSKSRLLADLIQSETKQPFILLPAAGGSKIFFCPPPKRMPAMEIPESDLARFIQICNPQQVLILGDDRYVEPRIIKMIDPRITILRVKNKDWVEASKAVSKLLDTPNLKYDYAKLYKKLTSGRLFKPTQTKPVVEMVKEESIEVISAGKDGKKEIEGEEIIAVGEKPAEEPAKAPAIEEEKTEAPAKEIKQPKIVIPAKDPELVPQG